MLDRLVSGGAAALGARIGAMVADRWGPDIRRLFDTGKGSSGALGGAFVDQIVLEGLSGAVWPSFVVIATLIALHGLAGLVAAPEMERVLVGLVACGTIAWTVHGVAWVVREAWPHLRLWAVTRLRPTQHARMVLFNEIRARHRAILADLSDGSLAAIALTAAIETLQQRLGLTPERAAFALADHLAPILVRHLLQRLALLVAPVAAALLYYRLVLYPDMVGRSLGIGPWTVALYPLAALADWVAGTELRAVLHRGG